MNNRKYQKGMLLQDENELYRVLVVIEKILVIDCKKRTMPKWVDIESLIDFEVVSEAESGATELTSAQKKVAYERYNMISPIIPFVANEKLRAEVIKQIACDNGISVQTIRKYLCNYLASMNIESLAPQQQEKQHELTIHEKNIRKALNKWYYTTKKRTLKSCYTLMLEKYYCDETGKLVEDYPSYYQFRYYYRKYNKPSTEMISRNSLSYYQRNQRPLLGDGVQAFAGTIGMGMLDATICDIYLVNESNEIVGRP